MLSNREAAVTIWVGLVAVWALTKPEVRVSTLELARTLCGYKFLLCIVLLILNTILITSLIYKCGLWDNSMIKDTVVWFFAFAPMVIKSLAERSNGSEVFRRTVLDALKATAFVEFFMESNTMSLVGELMLLPLVAMLSSIVALGQRKKENAPAVKLATCLLIGMALVVLYKAIVSAVANYHSFGMTVLVRGIGYPPLMSILSVPFLYSAACYSYYDEIFIRLNIGLSGSHEMKRYAKWRVLRYCGVSLTRLKSVRDRTSDLMHIASADDVDRLINQDYPVTAT